MASTLPGGVAIGEYDLCLFRVGKLNDDCTPVYGTDAGVITFAITSMTASAEIEEGATVDFKNGCGTIMTTVKKADKVKRRNLSGVLTLTDYELFYIMFAGTLIMGKGTYLNKAIGYAEPGASSPDQDPVVLEVITKASPDGSGSCGVGGGVSVPAFTGHIFPKCLLTLGDISFQEGAVTINFTGSSENNPNYGSGPWRDWDDYSATVFPDDTAMAWIGYDAYPIPSGVAHAGFRDTPATS